MVIRSLLQLGVALLKENSVTTPQSDAAVLLCHALKCDRLYLITHPDQAVQQDVEDSFLQDIRLRGEGMPTAYINGEKEFMSLPFQVTPDTLIPRPDTETLCEWAIAMCKGRKPYILDVGTGSGCIGISLAKYMDGARVLCVDVSEAALTVAKHNAKQNGVSDRVDFLQMDILADIPQGIFDMVVSNPPYIETNIIPTLDRDVAEFEPLGALDGGQDGLVFYRRLAKVTPKLLASGGAVAFEVGHTQAEAVGKLLSKAFIQVGFEKDLAGIDRVVYGIKP